jgi:hypothetical protein
MLRRVRLIESDFEIVEENESEVKIGFGKKVENLDQVLKFIEV